MITDQDIAQAEVRLAAVKERARTNKLAARDGVAEMVEREVARVAELREAKRRQDAALKGRAVQEKRHRAELKALNVALEETVGRVADAREKAVRAIADLAKVLGTHNDLVATTHARLVVLQLPLADDDATYATGVGSKGVVRLDGAEWPPVPVDTASKVVAAGAMAEIFGDRHPGARVGGVARVHILKRTGGRVAEAIKAA